MLQWPEALGQRLAGDEAGPVPVRAWREREREYCAPLSLPVGPGVPSWLVWVQEMGRGHVMILHARFDLDLV